VAFPLPQCTAPAARLNQTQNKKTQTQNVVSFNFLRTTWELGVPGLSPCDSASVEHNGKRSPIVVMLLGSVDVSGHDIYIMTKCLIFFPVSKVAACSEVFKPITFTQLLFRNGAKMSYP
jgi:hypothetical protein